jgi:hypothetical protein
MKELGYHEGYQYAHSVPEAYIPQEYLPDELRGTVFYEPGPFGFEKEIAKRLSWWRERGAEFERRDAELERRDAEKTAGTAGTADAEDAEKKREGGGPENESGTSDSTSNRE